MPSIRISDLRAIAASSPHVEATLDLIQKLDAIAGELSISKFTEPISVLRQGEKGTNQLLNFDCETLESWTQHIRYSMRVRLRSLEPGIVAEIREGRLLPAFVLLRAHFEAAAMAALCLETLQDCASDEDWEPLADLIPKTLFGTALYSKAGKDDRILEMLSVAEQRTIMLCSAVSALDTFAFRDKASDELSALYALLCESAHPNHRGTKGFVRSEDLGDLGWEIQYSSEEEYSPQLLEKLVQTLLFSMRHGYAAAELLGRIRFASGLGGKPSYMGVASEDLRWIWTHLLQQEPLPNG